MPFWNRPTVETSMPRNWEKLPSHERRDMYEDTASIFPVAACIADYIGYYKNELMPINDENLEDYITRRQLAEKELDHIDMNMSAEQIGREIEKFLKPDNIYYLLFPCHEIVGYMKKNHANHMKVIITLFLKDIYGYRRMYAHELRTIIKGIVLPILNIDVLDVLLDLETSKIIAKKRPKDEIEEFYDHKNKRIESIIVHMDSFINKINPKTQESIRMLGTLHLYEYLPQADMYEEERIAFKKEFEKQLSIFADEKIHIPLHFANALLKAHNEKENGFKLSASQLKACEEAFEKRKMLLQDIINLAPNHNKNLERKLLPLGITDLHGNSIP